MIVVELEAWRSSGATACWTTSDVTGRRSSTTCGSRWATPRSPTGSRTPSTTAKSPTACKEVSDGRQFNLIEALAAAVADALVERFDVERVRVRVRKPQPAGVPAAHASATVER